MANKYEPLRNLVIRTSFSYSSNRVTTRADFTLAITGGPHGDPLPTERPDLRDYLVTVIAPLPSHLLFDYRVSGEPGITYFINAEIRQRRLLWWHRVEGTVGTDGTAHSTFVFDGLAPPYVVPAEPRRPETGKGGALGASQKATPRRRVGAARQVRPIPETAGRRRRAVETRHDRKGDYWVWFGTNRRRIERKGRLAGFSSDRDRVLHYGRCRVSIPKSHVIGSVGSSWWKRWLKLTDDRLKLVEFEELNARSYWKSVRQTLARTDIDDRDAVVFLHGYNVSFRAAAIRAAQLGVDLGIAGVMAFYSWPSKGTLAGYPADEASIDASEPFVTEFLTEFARRSRARRVHIIAHSMGNRALLRAIDRIAAAAQQDSPALFSQIILAAADVDQDTFRQLSDAYKRVAERTTMYVCARDRAVEASAWLHDFPRAGLTPPTLVVPGLDTISVSNVDLTLLGHGYVAAARELLADIHDLLRNGSPPERRFGLHETASSDGRYWIVGK